MCPVFDEVINRRKHIRALEGLDSVYSWNFLSCSREIVFCVEFVDQWFHDKGLNKKLTYRFITDSRWLVYLNILHFQYLKYARIWVFTYPYSHILCSVSFFSKFLWLTTSVCRLFWNLGNVDGIISRSCR